MFASGWIGLALFPTPVLAAELTQYFPAAPFGERAVKRESGWKIAWQVREPKTHNYGGSAVWEIQGVWFMKGYRPDGSEDWVKVLNRLALAEMYVPYHDGETEFFDITGFEFPLLRTRDDFLPKLVDRGQRGAESRLGAISARRHEDGYIISEVVDDHVRWMDNRRNNEVQRGQTLHLWATFYSGNYRYLLRYSFADDGTISVRAGGTAENYFDLSDARHRGNMDHSTHIHMAAWRMEFDLGNPETNRLEMIERETDDKTNLPITLRRPFNGREGRSCSDTGAQRLGPGPGTAREGGEVWDPAKFSLLRITSGQTLNRHQPPRNIAYTLRPVRTGSVRTGRTFTRCDFWVSRLRPSSEGRRAQGPEYRFIDVPRNVTRPDPIEGKSVVVWHQSGLNHIVRTEDYGPVGYQRSKGVAIASWTGFDLVPADLWHQTPFLKR